MAMAEGDDPMEGSVSSPVLGSVESKQSGDVLSPEDVAWADSCLIKDPEISHSNWNSLADALLETLSSLPDSVAFSGVEIDAFPAQTDMEILSMNEEAESSQYLERNVSDIVPINEEEESNKDHIMHEKTDALSERTDLVNSFLPTYNEDLNFFENTDYEVALDFQVSEMESVTDIVPINEVEKSNNDHIIHEKIDALRERTNLVNAFLPRYNEDLKKTEITDDGVDFVFRLSEKEPSTDDIFRVWDLDFPDEEDEFIKELNKALAGIPLQPTLSTFDDSGAKEESLDDLISGIAELSLKNSG
ncbi:uncharacterized protein LOC132293941 [Cornus florida]|uniref:uncharacterized protein LOC132293941 n=1 Tax=Cornus florida TaxID=4283 RepID=UPI002897F0A9|nr:uncharacterized protein LOC132293941 [Cornus florida]XP_059647600.1 uncharacterized protein LOC132293941 [Cornus florida]XP_059647601.1 uncharacterized protein LOC132293941 [Cornus florida]